MTPTISIVGVGASGSHCLRALLAGTGGGRELEICVSDERRTARSAVESLGPRVAVTVRPVLDADVVVLATPAGTHADLASDAIARGSSVVSMSDSIGDIRDLIELDRSAREAGVSLVAGAGFAPGLTCLLARHAGDMFDDVAEIAVAKAGTGGPACARQHHRAMKETAWDWFGGRWVERGGGSGRDLVWFPPPMGACDSYKAALPSPLLLQRQFPDTDRIVARVTATRRDRLTSRLPMLRPPHDDGGPGAVRVEVRGLIGGRFETLVYAVAADPSRGAGIVCAGTANAIIDERMPHGAFGLSELDDPVPLLRSLIESGLKIMTFDGTP